jgi:hypothetical protein
LTTFWFAVQSTNLILLVENFRSYALLFLCPLPLFLFYPSTSQAGGGVVGVDKSNSDPSNHDASSIVVFLIEAAFLKIVSEVTSQKIGADRSKCAYGGF